MPHVPPQTRSGRQNGHTKTDISERSRPAMARDDLSEAFAGEENNGPSGKVKGEKHSTHVKSRKTKESKFKTPIR